MAYTKGDWWHVDANGRRIGWLWPEDMEAILEARYGNRKWVNQFADDFGYSRSAVDRWRKGETPIPKDTAMIITMLGALNVRQIPVSTIEAEWLPDASGANAKLSGGQA